ncbi:DUF805 domain-containing protein [Nesterenkonia natronophila]|uniref:DUF805 domain-containing protein n=1 Tax=Nesterenkonia natronophila TaxID=2174932 RepID=A0A3A4G2W2_9MICC|nr:DUF805 domain-containing protein [Nesterenkonia natronophila]RJN32539.1 DUF805 domain-containing protein [Nesterenkonia natronophila]
MTYHAHAALPHAALPYGPDRTLTLFLEDFAKFKGFATRAEFWWPFVLILTLHLAIAATGLIVIGTTFADDLVSHTSIPLGADPILLNIGIEGAGAVFAFGLVGLHVIIGVVTIMPLIAVTWRRLHDVGLPGPTFFLVAIPVLGWIGLLLLLARPSAPEKHRAKWSDARL